jgi:nucleotidyltransferase substrate binding protein (TIGR01987 family)
MTPDVRWKQRFSNFSRALRDMSADLALRDARPLSRLEEKGLIHSFEMVHELAWNVLKDFLESEAGTTGLLGSKDSTREAFKRGLISDGETWMDMIRRHNLTSHVYDEDVARQIVNDIALRFHGCFLALHETLSRRLDPSA